MSRKRTLALIFVGDSPEHSVSINSAANVFRAIDLEKYDIKLIFIDKSGSWWFIPEWLDDYEQHNGHKVFVSPNDKGFVVVEGEVIKPDVIFPILHGKNGEDGSIQGVCQLLQVPYVGPSLLSAAATMDKDMTKRLVRDAGVPVVDWLIWLTSEAKPVFSEVVERFGLPVFVKPSRAGSSAGVSRVNDEADWDKALELAAEYDDQILIEPGVVGNEFQVSVLGENKPRLSSICEIVIGAAFHDFADKYNPDSAAKFFIPARLDDKTTEQVLDYARAAYAATAGRGMARIDFFVTSSGEIYLNEINSIPGFTNASVYPKLWTESGLSYARLVQDLIELAKI